VIAQLVFAFEDHRIWAIQAAGFGVAGLVLMIGRFITAASKRRSAAASPAKTPVPPAAPPRRQDSNGQGVHSEVTFRVEETWK
jgi:hypothetical protein